LPDYQQLNRILKNPVYAGAFAHGKSRTQTKVVDGRSRKSSGRHVPLEQWAVATPAASPAAPVKSLAECSAPRPRKERSLRLPADLPVVEEVLEPAAVQAEPAFWRCIGQETSEQLDYEPGRFLLRRTIRRKYVHRTQPDAAPVIAPLPESLQEGSLAAPGLLAQIIVSKYSDHLPLWPWSG
jgi:hypothetical protein